MILLALSNLFCAPGGIPAFNRLLCRAAAEHAAALGLPLSVLVLADAPGTRPGEEVAGHEYHAFGGDRGRFALAVLRRLSFQTRLCLGHVNLCPLGLPALLRGRGFGVVAHGTEVWTRLPLVRRIALRRARAVGCVSDHTARSVHEVQGVSAARCVRLINALCQADVPPPAAERAPGGPLSVLSITRLHPGEPKGIDLMLQTVAQLPQVHYTVAGEGEALPGLRALARRLGIEARVASLGRVSDAQREDLLCRADLFALPSSGEGFGIVYLEAMAHGKPCIAARVGGAPEVVLDGVTGFCVPPAVGPLRDALFVLSADPALRRRLGEAGQLRLRQHFTYAQFRNHAFRFFERLY